MKNNPLVSIIIPCYNYDKYLSQSVESALAQTHKNVEIIIINDGSTDDTSTIAKEYAAKYKNIKFYDQDNIGIVKTRNKGLSLAKGDYLVQLDADDWIEPDYIEKTLACAKKQGVQIVYTQAQIFGRVEFLTDFPEFNIEYLKHNNYIHASSLVEKSVFAKGRRYDEYLADKWFEDWDVFLDACLDGATAALVNEPLLHYRKHQHTISRSDDLKNLFKEVLVRHHILSKQNSKHPDKMWYFSPYIKILKESIDLYQTNDAYSEKIKSLEHRLKRIESTMAYRAYRKMKRR